MTTYSNLTISPEVYIDESVHSDLNTLKPTKPLHENKYESFADEREGCNAKIFINGKYYFEDLFHFLMKAKTSIYMLGWAVAPELYLIRPVGKSINDETKLMDVLLIKAKENVMIKILIYKEVPYTLPLDSLHSEELLASLHSNIKVRRFPSNSFPYNSWTNHEKLVVIDNEVAYTGGIDLFWGRWDDEQFRIKEESNSKSLYFWPGIDFSNDRIVDRTDLKTYQKEYLDRNMIARLPWHDVACRIEGPTAIDALRHFLQRWFYAVEYKPAFPISFDDYLHSIKLEKEDYDKILNKGSMSCQFLRSCSEWSTGNYNKEYSILNAYCDLIDNANSFIYIQNQFFISNSFTKEEHEIHKNGESKIINNIALHIRKRIERAYNEGTKFHVFIFLPFVPAFSGDIQSTQAIKTIFKYTYRTISRHKGLSLVEKLIDLMSDKYTDYITFYSLRTHDDFHGIPKTEMIYIHSKIMIVDDESVIVGSANINDRSMLGNRDSEIAVLIKGKGEGDLINSVINGENVEVFKLAFDFRINLLKLHLGVLDTDNEDLELLKDPLNNDFLKFVFNRALKNTCVNREIFKPIPDDIYESFSDFKYSYNDKCKHCLSMLRDKYLIYKDKIKGFIVEFPLGFLKKENLDRGFTKEKVVNVIMFL